MKNVRISITSLCLLAGLAAGASMGLGCGSNSSVSATIPRTPTPAGLRQGATPPPTATAIPGE